VEDSHNVSLALLCHKKTLSCWEMEPFE